MRQIVLDTETTGLETRDDHRIIEIGCVELRGEVIVETRIEGAVLSNLRLGMPMELVLTEFAPGRTTFAFRPSA